MDRVASNDQTRAHIESGCDRVVTSCIQLTFSNARVERGEQRVEQSIDLLARSRIRLSQARRTLTGAV